MSVPWTLENETRFIAAQGLLKEAARLTSNTPHDNALARGHFEDAKTLAEAAAILLSRVS